MKILNSNREPVCKILNKNGEVIFNADEQSDVLDDHDLTSAEMQGYILEGVKCIDTDFSHSNLTDCDFYWAIAFGANFSYAMMLNVNFRGADLSDSNFSYADLTNADFGKDNLGNSTIIKGTNFKGANIHSVNFRGAKYNYSTVFPENFNPVNNGLIFEE